MLRSLFFFGSKRRKEKSLRPSGVSQKRNTVFAGLRPTTRELLKKLDQNFYPLSLRPSSARVKSQFINQKGDRVALFYCLNFSIVFSSGVTYAVQLVW